MSQPYVLILYYSRTQGTANVALRMARGVDQVEGIEPRLRTVPPVSAVSERTAPSVPDDGAVFCSKEDLDRKSTRQNSSQSQSRMPSSA